MIHESWPWKEQLLSDADLIEKWAAKPSATMRRSILIEKKVFLSAYAMRKLFEGEKLSSNFDTRNIAAERYDLLPGQKLTWRMVHDFHEVFDLSKSITRTMSVWTLIDTIIHSKVFMEYHKDEDDPTLVGFFVTSDKRDTNLWMVSFAAFTDLMRRVGRDYPSTSHWLIHPETKERYSWRGDGEPSPEALAQLKRAAGHIPK
jgi:hypothetical protein